MLQDAFSYLKYSLSQISFKRRKSIDEKLKEAYGQPKDDSFDFSRIDKYFRNKDNSQSYQILSDKTCNDLDFDEVFMQLDRTNSKVGQQYLYNKLRVINRDEKLILFDEEIIEKIANDEKLRLSIQKQLISLNHKDAYYITTLFQDAHIKRPAWFPLIPILSIFSLSLIILSIFKPLFFIGVIGVFVLNFVIHYWNKNNLAQYVNSIPQLLQLKKIASNLFSNSLLQKLSPDLLKSLKLINQVKRRMSFFKLEAKLQGEFEAAAWFIFELIKILFVLEPLLLFGVLKKLETKRKSIERVFEFVGHVDFLISVSSVRKSPEEVCIPNINTNDCEIVAREISHPLIQDCKANSITINEKSILLTGSNMSGKTSFIRAVGLNIIIGLTINTCFAQSMSFPLLKVFSAIRISDDLLNDKSYYFEEVLTIKEMMEEGASTVRNLFLLDEIFKGTNTVERISAGKAVLSALNKNNNTVLVSTHDIELTDMLSDEYELYHFSEVVDEKTIGFDYKLKEGKLKNRNAIRILEINNYPKEVVSEAVKISNEFDKIYLSHRNK